MKVVEHPELKKAFRKLDILWANRRKVGVHKNDVENIFIETFDTITDTNKECPYCFSCGGQMTHTQTVDDYKFYFCTCQDDVGILHSITTFDPIQPEGFDDPTP